MSSELLPNSVSKYLSTTVRSELARSSAEQQSQFVDEYQRKAKSTTAALALWLLFGFHYLYLGKPFTQFFFWATGGGFLVWWFVDLFRIAGMVAGVNRDTGTNTLRVLKAITS